MNAYIHTVQYYITYTVNHENSLTACIEKNRDNYRQINVKFVLIIFDHENKIIVVMFHLVVD